MCTDVSFWRQSLILSTSLTHSFSNGVMLAFPSLLNPALLANSTDIHATVDQTSWITSVIGLTGTIGFVILSFVMQKFGRKIAHFTTTLFLLVGCVMIVFASNFSTLLAARSIQGLDFASYMISAIIIGEYCHPKRRGYFIVLRKLFLSAGVLLCHALTLCCTWRQVAGLCTMFCVVALIANLFWPESPPYLALKGRFDECEASYKWLNGNLRNRKELDALIFTQTTRLSKKKDEKFIKSLVRDAVNIMIKKESRNSLFITVFMILTLECGGRHYLMAYVIKIMGSLVGENSSAVYIVLGGDCLIILATIISCILVKHFKRRPVFFSFGLFSISLMFLFSLLLILQSHYEILSTVSWLAPSILVLYSFVSGIFFPLIFPIMGEIYPSKHRELVSGVAGIASVLIYFVSMKLFHIYLLKLGLSGTFLLNGIIFLVSIVILYFILPETKDKTLLEIECEMRGEEMTLDEVIPLSSSKNT